jgi:hypothetical protein
MPTPLRTRIRDAVFAAVSNAIAVPTLGGRVTKQRYHAVSEDDLVPGALAFVQSGDEELGEASEWPRPRVQTMRFAIDVIVVARNAGDVDAVVDQAMAECRAAVAADPTAGGVAMDIEYQGIADYGEDEENQDIVKAPMRFVAQYATRENDATTPA